MEGFLSEELPKFWSGPGRSKSAKEEGWKKAKRDRAVDLLFVKLSRQDPANVEKVAAEIWLWQAPQGKGRFESESLTKAG